MHLITIQRRRARQKLCVCIIAACVELVNVFLSERSMSYGQPVSNLQQPGFGEIRATLKDDKLFVVGVDVARALGYSRPDRAIARCVEAKDKSYMLVPVLRRTSKSVEAESKPS